MFDKFLCKKIHKEEITLSDVINFLNSEIPLIIPFICMWVVFLCYFKYYMLSGVDEFLNHGLKIIGISLLLAAVSFIPVAAMIVILWSLLEMVFNKVGSVKIAKCPNKKE